MKYTVALILAMGCQPLAPSATTPPPETVSAQPVSDGDAPPAPTVNTTAPAGDGDEDPGEATPDDWPSTVDEAAAELVAGLDAESMTTLLATERADLIQYHHGWGTGIRNSFGLWGGNDALMKSCGKPHPDDCSMVIIEATWDRAKALEAQGALPTPD